MAQRCLDNRQPTINQDSIRKRVHGPDVRRPISVTQASREWKQSREQLIELPKIDKRSESETKDHDDADSKVDTVQKANVQDRLAQAVCP